MKNNKLNIILAIGLVLMVGLARIANFQMAIYNFAPVCALGLFSGAIVKNRRIAFLLPVLAQLMGDLYISLFTPWQGFYGIEQVCVYGALLAVTFIGMFMKKVSALNVLGYTLAGAVAFFIISNLGVWIAIESGKADLYNYGKGFPGLINTYVAAIPFFRNTLMSELTGSILLFGGYHLLQLAVLSKMQKAKA